MNRFSVPRSKLLELLEGMHGIDESRKGAFLGRFQHLQRLKLVEGINPGRGKAAEYQAHQMVTIALAMDFLQLGLTPERAVRLVRSRLADINLAIESSVGHDDAQTDLRAVLLFFDPAEISVDAGKREETDWADYTFMAVSLNDAVGTLRRFFHKRSPVTRLSFVSISNTIWNIAWELDGGRDLADDSQNLSSLGPDARLFLSSLREWCSQNSNAWQREVSARVGS